MYNINHDYVNYVGLNTRFPLVVQRATLKNWEEPGDEVTYVCVHICVCVCVYMYMCVCVCVCVCVYGTGATSS